MLLLIIPESAIALDADIQPDNMQTSAVSAALTDNEYSSVAASAVVKAAPQDNVASFIAAKEKAEAEAKAKAEAEAKAKAQAEAKAKAKAAAKAKAKTEKAAAPKKAAASSAQSGSSNPSGIPDKYTVVNSFTVKAYAYTGGGTTASGKKAGVGRIAVDPKVIPLGTVLYVEGYGVCVAADTGGNIKGKTVDLYMNSEGACRSWGKRYVTCYILK
jgi:3D (Asp-Asp-Asp) domain-containing protein